MGWIKKPEVRDEVHASHGARDAAGYRRRRMCELGPDTCWPQPSRTVARASAAAVLPVHGQVLAPAELLQARGEQILDPPQALLVGCFGADR